MSKDLGWIRLYRSSFNNRLYFSEPFTRWQAWVDLLLLANHKSGMFRVRGIKVEVFRGQTGFSAVELADRWRWSRGKVNRFLVELKDERQIVQQKNNVTTLISIVNYEKYQTDGTLVDTQVGTQVEQKTVHLSVHETDINKNDNKIKNKTSDTGLVIDMVKIFKKYNHNIQIEPDVHYPPCLQIAYRIAKLKGWEEKEVLNGKIADTLKSWEKIVEFIKSDDWLSGRSLMDLNTNKEWDRLVLKMSKVKTGKKDDDKEFMKSIGL